MAEVIKMETAHVVSFKHANDSVIHKAVFDNLVDAQLWWDTIYYLRKHYQSPMEPRPR